MAKYIRIFALVIIISSFISMVFASLFMAVNRDESVVFTFGSIIIVLLAFLIAQIYYLIDLVKKKNRL